MRSQLTNKPQDKIKAKVLIYRSAYISVRTSVEFVWMYLTEEGWLPYEHLDVERLMTLRKFVQDPGFPRKLRDDVRELLKLRLTGRKSRLARDRRNKRLHLIVKAKQAENDKCTKKTTH